jgi:hypothetical protein
MTGLASLRERQRRIVLMACLPKDGFRDLIGLILRYDYCDTFPDSWPDHWSCLGQYIGSREPQTAYRDWQERVNSGALTRDTSMTQGILLSTSRQRLPKCQCFCRPCFCQIWLYTGPL